MDACVLRPTGPAAAASVGTDLELAVEQILHPAIVDGDEHQVRILPADLQAEGAARHTNEGRSAPAVTGAAGDDSLAVLTAEDEGRLS